MLAFFILIGIFQLQIFFALADKMTMKTGNLTIEKHTFWNLMSLIVKVYCLASELIFYKNMNLNIMFWDFVFFVKCELWTL